MEKEKFGEDIEICYDGGFAAVTKIEGKLEVERSLQLLNYMKGKGYRFVGTSSTIAYFEEKEIEVKKKK